MFTLTIETGNDAMRTPDDIASALRDVEQEIVSYGRREGRIRDGNGNTVGSWGLTLDEEE